MKVLQTVKYYDPSKGGMESVVKNIVQGISELDKKIAFTVYSNHHYPKYRKECVLKENINVIKEKTPFILKSQPLNLYYKGLRKLITQHDIIHHHYPFPNIELSLLRHIDVLRNKKFIITWHANINTSRWGWIKKIYDPLIHILLKAADDIIVTSPQLFSASDILQEYRDKVKVIPLCFEPIFQERVIMLRSFPTNRLFRIIFVGKLRKYKGVVYLLEAIKDLPVELTIVGDGEEEENLRNSTSKYNLTQRVTFYKNIDNELLFDLYNQSDIFVLPSINEAEAFGVVQLEAMATGLPVINTLLRSGVPYVSLDGLSGYTVPPQNVTELKGAIQRIITDPKKYEEMSFNSLERSKLFTREAMSKAYLDLYINEK